MTPPPITPNPSDTTHSSLTEAPSAAVLDRVAGRVRQRLAAEQAAQNSVGEGPHAASLIWPWPL